MLAKKNVITIKGKEYLTAPGRIAAFRLDNPTWGIVSELITIDDHTILYKVTVKNEAGVVMSSAHGSAPRFAPADNNGKFPNWAGKEHEKAETAALSRALAWLGYGDIDEPQQTVKTKRPLSPDTLIQSLRDAADKSTENENLILQLEAQNIAILASKLFDNDNDYHALLWDLWEIESAKQMTRKMRYAFNRWLTSDADFVRTEIMLWRGDTEKTTTK